MAPQAEDLGANLEHATAQVEGDLARRTQSEEPPDRRVDVLNRDGLEQALREALDDEERIALRTELEVLLVELRARGQSL